MKRFVSGGLIIWHILLKLPNIVGNKTRAYQGVRDVRFFGKFGVLCFLETPVLRFALLPYYRRYATALRVRVIDLY